VLDDCPPPLSGPAGGRGPRLCLWAEALCTCGATLLLRCHGAIPLMHHISRCLHVHRLTGRGETLQSCGDVESNPGPPLRRTAIPGTSSTMAIDGTDPSTEVAAPEPDTATPADDIFNTPPGVPSPRTSPPPRRARLMACPIQGCQASRQHLTPETLLRHLGQTHVKAGEGVPPAVLATLGYQVCTPCRHLVRVGHVCAFCATRSRRQTPAQQADSSSLTGPLLPNPPPLPTSGSPLTGPCPSFEPSIQTVLLAPVTTIRHIPPSARREFASALGSLLLQVTQHPTWEGVYHLFVMPKLTLWAPRGRKAKAPLQMGNEINRRLRSFADGNLSALWQELGIVYPPSATKARTRASAHRGDDDTLPESVVAGVRGLVEEGAFAKAAKHLVSRGLLSANDPAVLAKLRDLHPTGNPVHLGGDHQLPTDNGFRASGDTADWEDRTVKAVARFPPGSAPGPSGLRPSHLKDCFKRPGSALALRAGLAAFVHTAIDGKLPGALKEHLCASTLIPLAKKDGGIRPIAVGDTLRRLIGKVLLRTDDALEQSASLQPRQCGVGMPFAAEMIGMGMQRIADADIGVPWVALQVDVRNAFNSVDRSAMLATASRKLPSSYNWLAWCYGQPTPLYCQGRELARSTAGVHQGDAMGPLGFSLALEQALDQCSKQERRLPWCTWYLDDGLIVGALEPIADYLAALVPALQNIGLQINLTKCSLWGPGIQTAADPVDNVPDALDICHPLRHIPITPYGGGAGITVLGVPCDAPGQGTHAGGVWGRAVDATLHVLSRLRQLPDGQIRHCLVRYCLDACKVNHLMRSTNLDHGAKACQDLCDALKTAVCDIVGCGITANAWEQATLPIRFGGLGIRDPAHDRAAARLAALANYHTRASMVGLPVEYWRALAPDTHRALTDIQTVVGPQHDVSSRWASDASLILSADKPSTSQRWWAEQVAAARRQRLVEDGTARDHVRLLSQEGPLASAWLAVTPSRSLNTLLPDTDFRSLCRFWLGLPLLPDGHTYACPLCHEPVDPFGDHFVSCKHNGITRRHNALRDAISTLLSGAGVTHIKEAVSRTGSRPADILLINWDKGKDLAIDITVRHPLTLDNYPLTLEGSRRHLAKAEADKMERERRDAACTTMRWGFQPAAFSPWGALGPSAKHLLREVTRRVLTDVPAPLTDARSSELLQHLSITLARHVGQQLSLRCRVLDDSSPLA
jgi:hypothetical protein